MDEARWARYAALGGIWFVVLNVIGAFLPGAPPKTTDSAMKIAKYFHDHHRSIEIGTLLLGLGLIGLFWWFGGCTAPRGLEGMVDSTRCTPTSRRTWCECGM